MSPVFRVFYILAAVDALLALFMASQGDVACLPTALLCGLMFAFGFILHKATEKEGE